MSDQTNNISRIDNFDIAVLIPCLNEEVTIAKVVNDFKTELPNARVYVYDNSSEDRTAEFARAAGAVVQNETMQGKGSVVRRMFADIDADVYVLVDGDATYDAKSVRKLIACLVSNKCDMVTGARVETSPASYRAGHRFGNQFLTSVEGFMFGSKLNDMLTGYRVFSRRFVKSFPSLESGFEIETSLTIHAHRLKMRIAEIPVPYTHRPTGSTSKLNTFKDGWRILKVIAFFIKEERPLAFFSFVFGVLALASLALGAPIVYEFMQTGQVPRLPTAILATGTMLLAFLSLLSGIILDNVAHGRLENKRLHYLALPPTSDDVSSASEEE